LPDAVDRAGWDRLTAAGLALVLGSSLALITAGPAGAADHATTVPATGDGDSAVTWALAPADLDGPDGRRWIELTADPGQTVTEQMAVTNLSSKALVFSLSAADGLFTAQGRFMLLPDPDASTGAGTWITLPGSVEVAAGQTEVVPFTVTVPADAEPGDHAAGVSAALKPGGSSGDGASMGVTSIIGFRVMTRVTGQLEPALVVTGLAGSYHVQWHPLRPGRLTVGFDLVNTGNARLTVAGTATAAGQQVVFPGQGEPAIELLPGDTRHVQVGIHQVWPAFRTRAAITATAAVLALEGAQAPSLAPVGAAAWTWALPWPQVASLAGLGMLAWAILTGRRRSRQRLTQLLAQTAAKARANALADLTTHATPNPPTEPDRTEGTADRQTNNATGRPDPEDTAGPGAAAPQEPGQAADSSQPGGRLPPGGIPKAVDE
jgi:hypothetical protein